MADREYAYYSGCSLEGTAGPYDASVRLVMKAPRREAHGPTRLELLRIDAGPRRGPYVRGSPCRPEPRRSSRRWAALPSTTPCPSCLSAFKKAHRRMARNKVFRDEVNSLLDVPYNCTVTAKSILQVIYEDMGLEEVARPVTTEMPDLRSPLTTAASSTGRRRWQASTTRRTPSPWTGSSRRWG